MLDILSTEREPLYDQSPALRKIDGTKMVLLQHLLMVRETVPFGHYLTP